MFYSEYSAICYNCWTTGPRQDVGEDRVLDYARRVVDRI